MAQLPQFPGLVVRRAARLHASEALRQLGNERHDMRPRQGLTNDDVLSCTDGVNLEDSLGQIDANSGNLHGDRS
jgi:hypothetical protein